MKNSLQLVAAIVLLTTTAQHTNIDVHSNLDETNARNLVNDFSVCELVETEITKLEQEKANAELKYLANEELERESAKNTVSRGDDRGVFTATAYDLSVASCGKKQSHPAYGITASGYSLVGQDRESTMTVATDPKVIPLGTKVYLEFIDQEWQHWNGIYTSRDTGSAIKGSKIDIFYKDTGDNETSKEVFDFGKRKVRVTVLPKGQ